jgi:hypothetical protein
LIGASQSMRMPSRSSDFISVMAVLVGKEKYFGSHGAGHPSSYAAAG